jgi:hypothetical protein
VLELVFQDPPAGILRLAGAGWERRGLGRPVELFLTGVLETAKKAARSAKPILNLFEADRGKIEPLKRATSPAFRGHQPMRAKPLLSCLQAAKILGLTMPTVTQSPEILDSLVLCRRSPEENEDVLSATTAISSVARNLSGIWLFPQDSSLRWE